MAAIESILDDEAWGRQSPDPVWHQLDLAAATLRIDGHAQLTARRGKPSVSPDGKHSTFFGERCVYCGANGFDVSLYALDPAPCPPAWACSASHPDPDEHAYCQLAPHEDGTPHRYQGHGFAVDGSTYPVDLTWTGRRQFDAQLAAMDQVRVLAKSCDSISEQVIAQAEEVLRQAGLPLPADLPELMQSYRKPRRPFPAVILRDDEGYLTPALAGGPDLADLVMAFNAIPDDVGLNTAMEEVAERFGLDTYEVHHALEYAAAGVAPVPDAA